MKHLLLALAILAPASAHAAIYDVTCTSPCVASDGTTQPSGTILNLISWNGVTPYVAMDGAGNQSDVALVADPQGTGIVYQPANTTPVPAQNETDCAVTTGGSCTLPAGTGLTQWTGTGTIASYTVALPKNPVVGPQSMLQANFLGAFTITTLTIQDGSGNTIKSTSVTAPKVVRIIYTNSGWAILPN